MSDRIIGILCENIQLFASARRDIHAAHSQSLRSRNRDIIEEVVQGTISHSTTSTAGRNAQAEHIDKIICVIVDEVKAMLIWYEACSWHRIFLFLFSKDLITYKTFFTQIDGIDLQSYSLVVSLQTY